MPGFPVRVECLLRALGILLLSQRALFRGSASLHGVDVGVPAAPGRIEDARSGDADGPGDTTAADGHVRATNMKELVYHRHLLPSAER
jgi:hypothetical protein